MATPEQFFLLCLADLPSGVRIKIKATDTYNVLVTIEAKRGGFGVVSCQEMPSEAVYAAFLMWDSARRACMVYPGSVESAYQEAK